MTKSVTSCEGGEHDLRKSKGPHRCEPSVPDRIVEALHGSLVLLHPIHRRRLMLFGRVCVSSDHNNLRVTEHRSERAAASYHFEQAEHRCYLANVENQLGLIYLHIDRFDEAHQHLDRSRSIHASLKDAGTVAQVDETRARVFLKQGRLTEAEQTARAAVSRQEKTGRHLLLAEALVTHGRGLARLNRYSEALFAFRRAFDLSEHAGITGLSADAALAAFQELGEHLTVVGDKQIPARKERLAAEHDAIKLALEQSEGSVTYAARILGMSVQAFTYMLNTRHKDLLRYRTPVRRRRPRRQ